MDPATTNLLIYAIISAIGGYAIRWFQSRNPQPVPPPANAEPTIGNGLILKLILDALKSGQLSLPSATPPAIPATMLDNPKALDLLRDLLHSQPPKQP